MKIENQTAAAKQEYQTPEVCEFGDISTLTLTGPSAAADGAITTQT